MSTHVLRLKAAESFLGTSQCTYFIEKFGLRDVKRADFIRYWRRSGLKNPDKPKIFIKKNEWNHSYHQFHPILAKIQINWIRINRGLLYCFNSGVRRKFSLGGLFSGLWWSFAFGVRCLWRHNLKSYSVSQTNVLAKFVYIIFMLFYDTHPVISCVIELNMNYQCSS